jgi:hypothetical protein
MQYSYNPADSKSVRRCYAAKKIVIMGILGGFILLITSHPSGIIVNALIPYEIFNIPGMCPMTDPIAALSSSLPSFLPLPGQFCSIQRKKGKERRGFWPLLFILVTIPNQFAIRSSMKFPAGSYLSRILNGFIGFPLSFPGFTFSLQEQFFLCRG